MLFNDFFWIFLLSSSLLWFSFTFLLHQFVFRLSCMQAFTCVKIQNKTKKKTKWKKRNKNFYFSMQPASHHIPTKIKTGKNCFHTRFISVLQLRCELFRKQKTRKKSLHLKYELSSFCRWFYKSAGLNLIWVERNILSAKCKLIIMKKTSMIASKTQWTIRNNMIRTLVPLLFWFQRKIKVCVINHNAVCVCVFAYIQSTCGLITT